MSILFDRMSVRKFQDKEIEPEKIEYMLKAGMQAPSAHNQRPWEFYVITNKEMIRKLSEINPYAKCAAEAPVVIAAVYRKDCKLPDYVPIDMSACMENIWLAAVEEGLGGVWLGVCPIEDRMDMVDKILEVPENLRSFALFAVGYSAETRESHSRFNPDRIRYVR